MASSPPRPARALATRSGLPATLRAETEPVFCSLGSSPRLAGLIAANNVLDESQNAPPFPRRALRAPKRNAGLCHVRRALAGVQRKPHIARSGVLISLKGSPPLRPCSPLPCFMPPVAIAILGIKRGIHPSPRSCHYDCSRFAPQSRASPCLSFCLSAHTCAFRPSVKAVAVVGTLFCPPAHPVGANGAVVPPSRFPHLAGPRLRSSCRPPAVVPERPVPRAMPSPDPGEGEGHRTGGRAP